MPPRPDRTPRARAPRPGTTRPSLSRQSAPHQAAPHTSAKDSAPRPSIEDGPQRLQKILAAAGLGSRRHCEELVLAGRVEVDRQSITELGAKADRATQEIRVDGVPLARPRLVYFMVNKPTGILSTNADPSGRPRVIDMIAYTGRLFTVGRLDMSSEGLILVTNDGELANRLTHPRYGVAKTYQVEVAGMLDRKELEVLRRGVHLAEGVAQVVSAKVVRQYKQSTLLEIVLNEGRNREIRRILARVGHKVERLRRVAFGPLRLADLPTGQVRPLERDELRQLKQAAAGIPIQHKAKVQRRPKSAAGPRPAKPPLKKVRAVIGGDPSRASVAHAGGPRKPLAAKASAPRKSIGLGKSGGPRKAGGSRPTGGPRKSGGSRRPARQQTR